MADAEYVKVRQAQIDERLAELEAEKATLTARRAKYGTPEPAPKKRTTAKK
jgi:hypothetical protein